VTGPEGAFRRTGVKTTPRRRLELVRFAAQPSKGPSQRLEPVPLARRSQPMASNEVGYLGEIEGQAEALGDRRGD
jgi:hypothetical protein